MNQTIRTQLEHNIFPAAHQACEPWEAFPWHAGQDGAIDTHVGHSSQALAIDVFGTIKTSTDRDTILDAIAQTIGLPTGGPWDLTLEWTARPSLLNEPRPTQVDVYAESPHSVILFECKFTEQDGGACSQTVKRNDSIPCNGNYVPQINHENGLTSRCALSGKGIQYWDIIPKVFHLDVQTDYRPCPFAGPAYQWMRNLVAAYKGAAEKQATGRGHRLCRQPGPAHGSKAQIPSLEGIHQNGAAGPDAVARAFVPGNSHACAKNYPARQ